MQTDVAIIGAGPVGIFGAFQAGMLGMKSCIIDSLDIVGGQCSALYPEKFIYDIPGYTKLSAQELINHLVKQASVFNPQYMLSRTVINLKQQDNYFVLGTSSGDTISVKIVLIAAGAGCFGPNRPPIKNITLYEGKSVFYLLSAKNNVAGKKIVIAGGGDSAVDWAISLSSIANVTLVHRRMKFRAAPANVKKIYDLVDAGIINLVTNYQLFELKGQNGMLKQVIVSDLDGNQKSLDADILLPLFGLAQNLGPLLKFGLDLMGNRIIANLPHYETNIAGIYAVGDVAIYEGKIKLILTGFSEVALALHHAYSRVFSERALHFEHSTTKYINK